MEREQSPAFASPTELLVLLAYIIYYVPLLRHVRFGTLSEQRLVEDAVAESRRRRRVLLARLQFAVTGCGFFALAFAFDVVSSAAAHDTDGCLLFLAAAFFFVW